MFEAKVFVRTDGHPVPVFVAVSQRRGTIGGAVQHVQFMGKFMVDNIMTLLRVAAAVEDGIPDKDDRSLLEGLSDNGMGGFDGGMSNFEMSELSLGGNDCRGINQD